MLKKLLLMYFMVFPINSFSMPIKKIITEGKQLPCEIEKLYLKKDYINTCLKINQLLTLSKMSYIDHFALNIFNENKFVYRNLGMMLPSLKNLSINCLKNDNRMISDQVSLKNIFKFSTSRDKASIKH